MLLIERRTRKAKSYRVSKIVQVDDDDDDDDEVELTLLVAAMAMLSSNGCQLICKIFLLKSIWSASVSFLIRPPAPDGLPDLDPFFFPALVEAVELIGVGTPTFLALNAVLSACSTTSVSLVGSVG